MLLKSDFKQTNIDYWLNCDRAKMPAFIIFMLCNLSLTGFAQNTSESDSIIQSLQLKPVTVESSRLPTLETHVPLSLSVLDKSRIQTGQPQLSVRGVLDAIPGVFALNAENFAQDLRVSIRGFGARAAFGIRGVKVIVDGIPESTPDGQAQVDNMDLGIIEKLEVIRGPSSVLYGNASGGVLSFITEKVEVPFSEVRFTAGSFGLNRYQFKTGQKIGRIETLLYGSHTRIDGYRAHSETRSTLLNNKTSIHLDTATRVTVLLNYNNSPLGNDPGGLTIAEVKEDREQARELNVNQATGESIVQGRAGVVFDKRLGAKHRFQAKAYYTFRNFEGFIPFSVIQFDRSYTGGGLNYQFHTAFGESTYRFVAGIDIESQVDDRLNFENNDGSRGALTVDQQETFSSTGTYLIQEFSPITELTFTAGVRFDAVGLEGSDNFLSNGDDSGKLTFNQFNPMVGIVYGPNKAISIYSNFSKSFETPTLNELSSNPDGLGGFNTELSPQKANNFELGSRGWIGYKFRYELALFHIDVENELVPYELAAFPDREFYRNAGSSDRNGIELGLGYQVNKHLSTFLTYTYSDFKYETFRVEQDVFDGNSLPGIPDHMLYHEVRYNASFGLYGILQTRYVGALYGENTNTTKIDRFTVVNLRMGHQMNFGKWEIQPFLGVNNLLNAEYNSNVRINAFGGRFYEPASMINFFAGLRARVGH